MSENVQEEEKLSLKQEALIAALLSYPSIVAASKAVQINDKTARRWLAMPHFRQAYEAARDEQFNSSLDLLQQATGAAIRVLISLMKDDQPSGIRLRAAQIIYENSVEVRKLNQIEQRIEQIENLLKKGC